MSRTRKGNRKSGADNYPTPAWAVERFLEKWPDLEKVGTRWIEPCAGDGGMIRVVDAHREGIEWTACEIRDTTPALRGAGVRPGQIYIENFVEKKRFKDGEFDVAFLNPPFWLTMDFVIECMRIADTVVCMQRMNFLGSDLRNEWMIQNTPDLYVIPNRVSFSGNGKADSIENAWNVWGPHDWTDAEHEARIMVLETTPIEERRNKLDRRRIVQARDETLVALNALFEEAHGGA